MEHHWITERKISSIDPSNHAMQEKSWTLAKLYDMAHITSTGLTCLRTRRNISHHAHVRPPARKPGLINRTYSITIRVEGSARRYSMLRSRPSLTAETTRATIVAGRTMRRSAVRSGRAEPVERSSSENCSNLRSRHLDVEHLYRQDGTCVDRLDRAGSVARKLSALEQVHAKREVAFSVRSRWRIAVLRDWGNVDGVVSVVDGSQA